MASRERAAAIGAAASEWMGKIDRGLSAEERLALDEWLSVDTRHVGALARAQALWIHADRAQVLKPLAQELGYLPPWRRIVLRPRWATAASSVVLAIRHKCGWPTAVLRRRRALSRDTYRVGLSRVDRQLGFEAQIVNPAITEVILIHESLEAAQT